MDKGSACNQQEMKLFADISMSKMHPLMLACAKRGVNAPVFRRCAAAADLT